MLQLYAGVTSHYLDAFPMAEESQMPSTLMDFVRKNGAPNYLMGDNAKVVFSKATQEILWQYAIGLKTSEPHQQNQNPAERRIQDVKRTSNMIMDRTNTPAKFWLLCVLYVILLSNHIAHASLGNITPIEKAKGYRPDVSKFLQYRWFEPVYYLDTQKKGKR